MSYVCGVLWYVVSKYLDICSNLLTSNQAAALCLLTKLAGIVLIQSSQRTELCD